MDKLVDTLTQTTPETYSIYSATTIHAVLESCDEAETASAVQDLAHMVSLIKAAFWIERFVNNIL